MNWRKKREADLERELRSHLETEAEERRDRRAAQRAFGNFAQVKEEVREAWGWMWLERLGQDLRYALRTMRQSPGFTATAVLSLALGIGANTAIFSLIDALMLRWLPVRNPQELVLVRIQTGGAKSPIESVSYAIARALADQKDTFANVAGFSGWNCDVGTSGSANRVSGAMVTGGFYATLELNPVAGRLLTPDDDQPGAPPVAVISDGYWQRQFARNPGIIGQPVPMNGVAVTIVGVSPPGFVGANVGSVANITMAAAALPLVNPASAELLNPGNFWLRVLARPKAGVSISEVKARLAGAWPEVSQRVMRPDWPVARKKAVAEATFEFSAGGTGYTRMRETFQKPLLILMAVVALVLLIACANVANLLLARAAARQREISVRLSIGAPRSRIIRQLLTESTLLSLIGAAFGTGLAWLASRLLVNLLSTVSSHVVFDLTPNWHVLAFTSAAAIATGILFGLAPAFLSTAAGPSPASKESALIGRSRARLLSTLVSVQVALSLLLMIGAGLFVRTLQNLQKLDPGFKKEGVLLVSLEGRRTAFPQQPLDDIRRLPGVVSASISTHTPLSGSTWTEPVVPQGQPLPGHDTAIFSGVGPGFFDTMQTPLLSGREFTESDASSGPGVAVISEAFAARYLPGRNPNGQHLTTDSKNAPKDLEIVGVAKNVPNNDLRRAPYPALYLAYAQLKDNFPTTLEIRANGSLGQLASAVRQEIQRSLPNAPLEIRGLTEQVEATLVQERMMATLASGFGILALVLACIGLYGLLAYSVARRTKELGIRMALGAQRRRVIAMVVNGAIRLIIIGVALGLPAAWAASRWVKSMLFGLTPTDPATTAGAALILVAAALLAAYLPARNASRVDPMTALRH